MKILHTSDWHLGSALYGRKRYDEYESFLNWLSEYIEKEDIDVLLVAGDVFDNSTPSTRAQELYYRFLHRMARINGLQVVVTAGNHDSPSLLNAPKALLRTLDIHVIGSVTGDAGDEVLVMKTRAGFPSLIVCAVPYLRDRDIRTAEPGESTEDKTKKIQDGIYSHYREVLDAAEARREERGRDLPIIAMGHLFAEGGLIGTDDGVRELYVGNLALVRADLISPGCAYLALGHLHRPHAIPCTVPCRYCGSPLPMGFGEAGQEKMVIVAESGPGSAFRTTEVPVPCFRQLLRLKGELGEVEARLQEVCLAGNPVWVDVILEDNSVPANVYERLREMTSHTGVQILRVKKEPRDALPPLQNEGESLGDLNETEVFLRCLNAAKVEEEKRKDLMDAFAEILVSIREEDSLAG